MVEKNRQTRCFKRINTINRYLHYRIFYTHHLADITCINLILHSTRCDRCDIEIIFFHISRTIPFTSLFRFQRQLVAVGVFAILLDHF